MLSPTVSSEAVIISCTISEKGNRAVGAIDFPGAILDFQIPEDASPTFIKLNKYLTSVLVEIDNRYVLYV